MAKRKPHFIPDLTQAYKKLSVQIAAAGAAAAFVWPLLPADKQAELLKAIHIDPSYVVLVGFVAVIYGRLKSQTPPADHEGEGDNHGSVPHE